jgi:zinc and cadmium transporter
MSTLAWIVVAGVAMSALALVGGTTLLLSKQTFSRLVLPLVALAAGSLIGGALFHMLPESVAALGNGLTVYTWLALGFVSFLLLEQFLHWHHCHRSLDEHEPVGILILVADGVHNLIGGLAVGTAFVVDVELGLVTWLVAAAHEIPQELGDFGILVHSGWRSRSALAYNAASASTFLLGGLLAYGLAGSVDISVLVPFAAGNFIYIAAADLLPQLTAREPLVEKVTQTATFLGGLGVLYLVALLAP